MSGITEVKKGEKSSRQQPHVKFLFSVISKANKSSYGQDLSFFGEASQIMSFL